MKKLLFILAISALLINSCQNFESKKEYTIKQNYYASGYWTYVMYDDHIANSYSIDSDSITEELIKKDSLKAVKWIERMYNIK